MKRLRFLIEQTDQYGDIVFNKDKVYYVSKQDDIYYYVYSNKYNTPPWKFPVLDDGLMFSVVK